MQFACARNIKLRRGIQMLQAKTSVGTTLVGPRTLYTPLFILPQNKPFSLV